MVLQRRIRMRPSLDYLYSRNIAPTGAFDLDGGVHVALEKKHSRRTQSIFALNSALRERPDIDRLLDRGLINPASLKMVCFSVMFYVY